VKKAFREKKLLEGEPDLLRTWVMETEAKMGATKSKESLAVDIRGGGWGRQPNPFASPQTAEEGRGGGDSSTNGGGEGLGLLIGFRQGGCRHSIASVGAKSGNGKDGSQAHENSQSGDQSWRVKRVRRLHEKLK